VNRPSYKESDLSDKPSYMNCDLNPDRCKDPNQLDFARRQLQSLQSVDRTVEDIINKLEEKNLLDKTVIIFASDNGMFWGEHWFSSKGQNYQESTEVPLVIRAPGVAPAVRDEVVAVNLDVPQTILSIAGLDKDTQGFDLAPLLLRGDVNNLRDGVLIQGWHKERNDAPDWAAWRTKDYNYVLYESDEEEFYDLINDPYEIESQHNNPDFASAKQQMRASIEADLGLSILTDDELPAGNIGQPYNINLEPWGGEGPFIWSLFDGGLPKGLALSSDGLISGTIDPLEFPHKQEFSIIVEDSTPSPYNNDYGKHVQEFILEIL